MSSEAPPEPTGRKYRSKKQRPCDLCRSRKIHCQVPRNGAVCECCKRLNRTCTFKLEPLKRRARPDVGPPAIPAAPATPALPFAVSSVIDNGESPVQTADGMTLDMSLDMLDSWLHGDVAGYSPCRLSDFNQLPTQSPLVPAESIGSTSPPSGVESVSPNVRSGSAAEAVNMQNTRSVIPSSANNDNSSGWPPAFSLEMRKGYSNHLIGLSCESDPYLLRFYEYDAHDTYPMFRLDYRRIQDEANEASQSQSQSFQRPPSGDMPIQFALTDEQVLQDGVKEVENLYAGKSGGSQYLGDRLVRLYTRHVHPRFPVLSLDDLSTIREPTGDLATPVGLLSAVYALAMPFTFLDDQLSLFKGYLQVPTDDLWAIACRSYTRASCLSHLSLLQLCLMLLQRPPYNYAVAAPPGTWALSCAALSIAETLGVNLDPSSWRLPRYEISLRRRLWWLTYTQHVWFAIGLARPCHIQDANWDVDELTGDDLEPLDSLGVDPEADIESPVLLAHCRLSVIAADILKEFYTLRSTRKSPSLSILLTRAQPLRTRIESWRQTLPLLSKPTSELTEDDLVVGASLRLAHLTLEILIFRALLRPLMHDAVPVDHGAVPEPVSTIHDNCYACAKVGMEIVGSMKGKHFSTFWPSYVRYQLCYISNFVLLSLAQAPTHSIATRNKALLQKWRDTLRSQARAWPLARLATIRLDAISWKGLRSVLSGAGPDSPAMQLLSNDDHDPKGK
ncbi:fungal specific transcription factor domain protein [Ophiostoma piceae UAMH 11346]|uniref:Fungal specific transcription factor domain protein n=1 Tax=Ophiostoma piceae (strain UAMH 11346) TaxID=1262450 RepID=S3DBJ5_OPHP1|nr:fungal specific transcription factor domain protein [Ophiostoma piceae UAMH 11346]